MTIDTPACICFNALLSILSFSVLFPSTYFAAFSPFFSVPFSLALYMDPWHLSDFHIYPSIHPSIHPAQFHRIGFVSPHCMSYLFSGFFFMLFYRVFSMLHFLSSFPSLLASVFPCRLSHLFSWVSCLIHGCGHAHDRPRTRSRS